MRRHAQLTGSFILSALLLCGAAQFTWAEPGAARKMSVEIRQSEITIRCPDQVIYQIEPLPQWYAGLYAVKKLNFESAGVDLAAGTVYCTYSTLQDKAYITRPMPGGYFCRVAPVRDQQLKKFNQFTCKRVVAPAKK